LQADRRRAKTALKGHEAQRYFQQMIDQMLKVS
jgi:hypothetical protein